MQFSLTKTSCWNTNEEKEKYKKLGFTFSNPYKPDLQRIIERPWKDTTGELSIEINTLEDLINFVKKYGDVVFDGFSIEIYDEERE